MLGALSVASHSPLEACVQDKPNNKNLIEVVAENLTPIISPNPPSNQGGRCYYQFREAEPLAVNRCRGLTWPLATGHSTWCSLPQRLWPELGCGVTVLGRGRFLVPPDGGNREVACMSPELPSDFSNWDPDTGRNKKSQNKGSIK